MNIVEIKKYGKIKLKLSEVMDKNGITRNGLATAANVRFEVIDKWHKNEVEKLDLDVLAKICCVLECEVEDLLEYSKWLKRLLHITGVFFIKQIGLH